MRLFRILSELRRRRVYRVAVAYLVAGFAVLEAADLILPALPAPAWIYRVLVILVLAGFPVAIALSWIFDLTPEGLRREEAGPDGEPDTPGPGWTGWPLLVGTLVIGLVGGGAWLAGRRTARPPSPASSGTLAVLPFTPAVPDSALRRVGRELVVTLSSSLAATADLEPVEPLAVLATVEPEEAPLPVVRAGEVAAALGAARLVHGSLVRDGDGVRLEVSIYETEGLRRLGNREVTAPRIDALTDSATIAVLRLIWRDAPSAPPNPGAISTGSVEALRAYLAGERAVAEGRWREAPEHFARAVAADSTFWFAYWRLQYALQYHGSPVDSVVRARAWARRHELPERDRLLIEARATTGSERLALLRDATTRFPSYWPAWWDLSDYLVHGGGYLGHTLAESRVALERTLALNPRFISAWSHLFWIAARSRDAEEMERVIDELSDARYDRITLREAGINSLAYYRAQLTLVEAGGHVPEDVVVTGVSELSSYRGPRPAEMIASSLMRDGFPRAQLRLSARLLDAPGATRPMRIAQHLILAHAWAACGAWDSALVAADRYAASASRPAESLLPYQVGVAGAWAGALDTGAAGARRPDLSAASADPPDLRAEAAWLDGLLAFSARDGPALARAREALAANEGEGSQYLDRSLRAFETYLADGPGPAGRRLEALETEAAAARFHRRLGDVHPFFNAVNRLTAARWLLETGDTVSVRRLLPWYEVVLPAPLYRLSLANAVLAGEALRLRSDLARATGGETGAARLEEPCGEPGRGLPVGGAP